MLSRHIDKEIELFLLRLSLGSTMLFSHGLPKLLDYNLKKDFFPDPLGVSTQLSLCLVIFSEVICSLLVILGVKIRSNDYSSSYHHGGCCFHRSCRGTLEKTRTCRYLFEWIYRFIFLRGR